MASSIPAGLSAFGSVVEANMNNDSNYSNIGTLSTPSTYISSSTYDQQTATTTTTTNLHHDLLQQQQAIDLSSPVNLIILIILITIILVSIIGNCLVCIAIFTDRRLRKLGNAFIVSLAIADLFVSCLVMTFALCNELMSYWMFGSWFCDVWISFDVMCCTASILNLCAISLDRFIHIKDCLLYNQWMTKRVAISAVMAIWFISALVSFVPIGMSWHRPPAVALPAQHAQLLLPNHSDIVQIGGIGGSQQNSAAGRGAGRSRRYHHDDYTTTTLQSLQLQLQSNAPANQHVSSQQQLAAKPSLGEQLVKNNILSSHDSQPLYMVDSGSNSNRIADTVIEASPLISSQRNQSDQTTNEPPVGQLDSSENKLKSISSLSPGNHYNNVNNNNDDDDYNNNYNVNDRRQMLFVSPSALVETNSIGSGHVAPPTHSKAYIISSSGTSSTTTETSSHDTSSYDATNHFARTNNPRQVATGGVALPQCAFVLTPTYAIISSTISFYIPCIIMLGLYSKLFACARRHVKNIQAITRIQTFHNHMDRVTHSQSLIDNTCATAAAAGVAQQQQVLSQPNLLQQQQPLLQQHQQPSSTTTVTYKDRRTSSVSRQIVTTNILLSTGSAAAGKMNADDEFIVEVVDNNNVKPSQFKQAQSNGQPPAEEPSRSSGITTTTTTTTRDKMNQWLKWKINIPRLNSVDSEGGVDKSDTRPPPTFKQTTTKRQPTIRSVDGGERLGREQRRKRDNFREGSQSVTMDLHDDDFCHEIIIKRSSLVDEFTGLLEAHERSSQTPDSNNNVSATSRGEYNDQHFLNLHNDHEDINQQTTMTMISAGDIINCTRTPASDEPASIVQQQQGDNDDVDSESRIFRLPLNRNNQHNLYRSVKDVKQQWQEMESGKNNANVASLSNDHHDDDDDVNNQRTATSGKQQQVRSNLTSDSVKTASSLFTIVEPLHNQLPLDHGQPTSTNTNTIDDDKNMIAETSQQENKQGAVGRNNLLHNINQLGARLLVYNKSDKKLDHQSVSSNRKFHERSPAIANKDPLLLRGGGGGGGGGSSSRSKGGSSSNNHNTTRSTSAQNNNTIDTNVNNQQNVNSHNNNKNNNRITNINTNNGGYHQAATHKAAVTLGIIMGTFLFCWVPFFCLNIIKAFCHDCIPSSVFRAFTWLGYANSALNPIIYGIHNSEFRNAFNRIFFKHLRWGHQTSQFTASYYADLNHVEMNNLQRRNNLNNSSSHNNQNRNNNNNNFNNSTNIKATNRNESLINRQDLDGLDRY